MADDKNKPREPEEKKDEDRGTRVNWDKEGLIDARDADRYKIS